jgi:hypothetical protein
VIELRRLLTDSDMFDTPALRWQPLFGDKSCRMLLPRLFLKPSRLLGAASVEEGFSVCGTSRGQLGGGSVATQGAAILLPEMSNLGAYRCIVPAGREMNTVCELKKDF